MKTGDSNKHLSNIISAIRQREYVLSQHYWEEFSSGFNRPYPSDIIESIGDDKPEIIESYPNDNRGASCLILGLAKRGALVHVVVGYSRKPVKIITAYYPSKDKWLDGMRRRGVNEEGKENDSGL